MKNIFVFGSNLSGIHGAGSVRHALEHHGAIMGIGVGIQGDSYAIPTKDEKIRTMSIDRIKYYVDEFISFAHAHPEMTFNIVAIGCGLAGFKSGEIAPLFRFSPTNCRLPVEFLSRLNEKGE